MIRICYFNVDYVVNISEHWIVSTSSSASLTSIAILITDEYISKLKKRYTKLSDWIKIDQKEADELKVCNHYLDKREDILNSTKFRVDFFGDVISKDSISPEKITKLKIFSARIM